MAGMWNKSRKRQRYLKSHDKYSSQNQNLGFDAYLALLQTRPRNSWMQSMSMYLYAMHREWSFYYQTTHISKYSAHITHSKMMKTWFPRLVSILVRDYGHKCESFDLFVGKKSSVGDCERFLRDHYRKERFWHSILAWYKNESGKGLSERKSECQYLFILCEMSR